jgi:hypothetical protein
MTNAITNTSQRNTARLAGLLWFVYAAAGGFGLLYVRTRVIVSGDAEATAAHLLASESLFRAAIVSTLVSQLSWFFFGVIVYLLFKQVNGAWAIAFLGAVMLSAAIAVVNVMNNLGALLVLSGADFLQVFSRAQLDALAMLLLRMNNSYGQGLVEVFWTPIYFSFGLLALRSRFTPKIFGLLLIISSIGYAVNVYAKLLVPDFYPVQLTQLAQLLGATGGIPTMLWFLIRGVKEQG